MNMDRIISIFKILATDWRLTLIRVWISARSIASSNLGNRVLNISNVIRKCNVLWSVCNVEII